MARETFGGHASATHVADIADGGMRPPRLKSAGLLREDPRRASRRSHRDLEGAIGEKHIRQQQDSGRQEVFGCIFLGDAFYFLYGLLQPRWHHARGQLLSFLAYDLVLIFPFLGLVPGVAAEFRFSLIVYIIVLVYSAALAVHFLFLNQQTRFGNQNSPVIP